VIVLSRDNTQDGESSQAESSSSVFNVLSDQFGLGSLQQLNLQGISKVCGTDLTTVELILKEIIATMAYLVAKGSSITMHMKFGVFSIRNGHMQFKQIHEEKPYYNLGERT
jgi:CCDC81 eukaryotic HU domain 2